MTAITVALAAALAQVGGAAAGASGDRTKGVDGAMGGGNFDPAGGYAPAFVKSVAAHIARVPGLLGKSHMSHVFGTAEIPNDGLIYPGTHLSVNLGDKKALRHLNDELRLMLLDLKKELHNAELQRQFMVHKSKMPMLVTDTPYFKAVVEPKLKAFDLSGFSQWVPTLNTAWYFEELELDPVIDQYFSEYPMASRTVNVPGALTRMKGQLVSDTTTFTAQYNTQSNFQMTAQDCVAHTDITDDLMQDLVPSAGGFERLRREVAMGCQRSKEDAIINGDDTTTAVQGDNGQDSDIAGGAATLFNKAFKGLRKRAIANSNYADCGGAGVSLATFNALLPLLGKLAKEKGDLLYILGPTIANKIIAGNVPEILTHEKFNGNATISTGVLPRIFGVEPYESEWVREDLGAAGVYAATSVMTSILLVKKSRFMVGKRAPMKVWATPSLASSDKLLLSAKERFTFGGVPQSASEKSVAIAYNLALT